MAHRYVDERKNPELYTKEQLEACAARNRHTNGRVEALEHFRRLLLAEVQRAFPDAVAAAAQPSKKPRVGS